MEAEGRFRCLKWAVAGLIAGSSLAAQAAGGWSVTNAFPNLTFDDALYLTAAPGTNRLYVCGREGMIWSFQNDPGTTTKTVFLNISARTQGWESCGLLGMAFHPDFGKAGSTNRGYFYVYYSYSANPLPGPNPPPLTYPTYNRLSRFTVPDGSLTADPNSELVLVNQFDQHIWHDGGAVFFGADGFLYFTNGDEGGGNDQYNVAQTLTGGLFAGLFRIDVNQDAARSHPIRRQPLSGGNGSPPSSTANYYIPNDNPFLDSGGGVLEEYWALGFRSPHRATFDSVSGQIWLGDVGQDNYEEVDVVQKGGNYQWAYREGTHPGPKPMPSPLIGADSPPVYDYLHDAGNNCVIGGYIYRGSLYAGALAGKYVFGDNGSGRVWVMTLNGANPPTVTELTTVPGSGFSGLSSFGLDEKGELYMCEMGSGQPLYKLVGPGGPPPPPPGTLPYPWLNQDVGAVGLAGSSSGTNDAFTVTGSGADIWNTADEFQFAYQSWTGDGTIVAKVASVQPTDGWAKAGVMFRESLAAGARHAMMLVSAGQGVGFERRLSPGGITTWTQGATATAPYWVKLVRAGNTFNAFRSADGATWVSAGTDTVAMASALYVGLAVTAHNDSALCTATFNNVSVTSPLGPPPPPTANWTNQDIGAVGQTGRSSIANGIFTVAGSGADIWDTSDAFQFVYQTWTGDGELVARVTAVQNTDGWAKAGVMFRESLTASARHGMMLVSAAGGAGFERRLSANGVTTWTQGAAVSAPYWVRLVRQGVNFSAYGSSDGLNWVPVGADAISIPSSVYVGLAVTSHNNSLLNTSTFDHVMLVSPVPRLSLARFDSSGRMLVQIAGELGRAYSLQASPDLRNWLSIGVVTNQGSPNIVLDGQATNQPRRFYRAQLQN